MDRSIQNIVNSGNGHWDDLSANFGIPTETNPLGLREKELFFQISNSLRQQLQVTVVAGVTPRGYTVDMAELSEYIRNKIREKSAMVTMPKSILRIRSLVKIITVSTITLMFARWEDILQNPDLILFTIVLSGVTYAGTYLKVFRQNSLG